MKHIYVLKLVAQIALVVLSGMTGWFFLTMNWTEALVHASGAAALIVILFAIRKKIKGGAS